MPYASTRYCVGIHTEMVPKVPLICTCTQGYHLWPRCLSRTIQHSSQAGHRRSICNTCWAGSCLWPCYTGSCQALGLSLSDPSSSHDMLRACVLCLALTHLDINDKCSSGKWACFRLCDMVTTSRAVGGWRVGVVSRCFHSGYRMSDEQ